MIDSWYGEIVALQDTGSILLADRALSLTRDELSQITHWPKVDLHRHLEGSLRFSTILDLAQQAEGDFQVDPEKLRSMVVVGTGDERTPRVFLSKFELLRRLYRSPEIIQRITKETIGDAAADRIRYLELRFTPLALAHGGRFPLKDVFDWVIEAADQASRIHAIEVGLIVSVNRHEDVRQAESVAQLAVDFRGRGVVALDLAGDETSFQAHPFVPIFASARAAGLGIAVHAGEWANGDAVRHALLIMGADRIAHGVRVLEDPEAVELALARRTTFEICLTSNLQSGVVPRLGEHPLGRMLDAGLSVTLNTDDPGICGTTLSRELGLAATELGLSLDTLKGLTLTAAQGTFLTERAKQLLEDELQNILLRLP